MEIEEEFSKEIDNTCMRFIPCKTGGTLTFTGLDLTKEESASLTALLMNGPLLKVEITKVE